jgi:hypothetical protein
MPEWAYKNIKRGALFEELLKDSLSDSLADYKFQIFNGKCIFVNVIHRNVVSKSTGKIRNFSNVMSPNWNKLNLILNNNPPMETSITKPKRFDEMVEIAEKLSQNIDFIRVDLYSVNEKIIFGELTNYPCAGLNTYDPKSFDLELGQKLNLDKYGLISNLFIKK